jgi:superfamily II RNA helicase
MKNLVARLKEERRLLKTLEHQAEEMRSREIAIALTTASPGTLLNLKGKHVPVSSSHTSNISRPHTGSGQLPYLGCLGADNRWYVVTTADVVGCQEWSRLSRSRIPTATARNIQSQARTIQKQHRSHR